MGIIKINDIKNFFSSKKSTLNELSESERNINIKPQYENTYTNSIMAGMGNIPENALPHAWNNDSFNGYINSNIFAPWNSDNNEINNDGLGLNNLPCSPSCCLPRYPETNKSNNFVPNSQFCNNSLQNAGCACITQQQATLLHNRGGNTQ